LLLLIRPVTILAVPFAVVAVVVLVPVTAMVPTRHLVSVMMPVVTACCLVTVLSVVPITLSKSTDR
jgi:hypothetical protein